MAKTLSPKMTMREFENGYWYSVELKEFADRIGIAGAGKLRKDQLETAIVGFLRTGKAALPASRLPPKTGMKDLERGLTMTLPIVNYTSNRETKDFIREQALRTAPAVRQKPGCWYRLNRWREEQVLNGAGPTYGDLVRQYIRLNKTERFERVPIGRYINFMSDYLANEKGATREQAIAAWKEVKKLDAPKDYASWARAHGRKPELTAHGEG